MGTFLMVTLNGDLFAREKETTVSESILKKEESPGKGESIKLPEMFLKNKEYDVGEVYEGTAVTHTFIIKNKGKGDLLIRSVKPG
jgi:hypothetical protein